jgi:hypothetical protein
MMPAEGDGLSTERRRLEAVSSMVNVVARHVDDLIQLRGEAMPRWLNGLSVPPGWQVRHLADRSFEPSRIAVCGQQSDGGWAGCETINAFAFTGVPPEDVVYNNADCTLRDLAGAGITSHVVDKPPLPGVKAVRSSGYFGVAGLWMWAQYSTYVAGSEKPGQGLLIEHAVFVESRFLASLGADIAQLTQAVYRAFVAAAKK